MTAEPARNSTTWWRESDKRHHLHPFTDTKALAQKGGTRIITKAEGLYLGDSEGNRGYGRKELADVAYQQMLELPYYNTFFQSATPPSIELAEKLAAITPDGLEHVFFASSGSEANDTIVRMIRHFWNLQGRPEKKTFISRTYAYHGSTMAATSLGGMTAMHEQADLPLPGFEHVIPPYWYDYGSGLSREQFGIMAARAIEEKILELGPETVAAFIGEPVQGAGGVIVPPDTYWPEVQRICRKHDVLLIIDEVISGFGRLGHWFGSYHYGLQPDVMTLAKGITSGYLPLSAVMVGDRVAETLIEEGGEFFHGFTYSGHPVACAVALENIRIIEEEGLVHKVRDETGPYLQQQLRTLGSHPLVGEVRGVGLLGAVELVKDKATRQHFDPIGEAGAICRDHCVANGLVMRAVRDAMICSPPLTFEKDHVDEMIRIARHSLDLTAKDLGVM